MHHHIRKGTKSLKSLKEESLWYYSHIADKMQENSLFFIPFPRLNKEKRASNLPRIKNTKVQKDNCFQML